MTRLGRITSDPAVCHGQPTVRCLHYTVESLLELLSAGMSLDEVLADHPDLEHDDLLAVSWPRWRADPERATAPSAKADGAAAG